MKFKVLPIAGDASFMTFYRLFTKKIKCIVYGSHIINKYSNKYLLRESDLFFDWYLPLFLNKKKSFRYQNKNKENFIKTL